MDTRRGLTDDDLRMWRLGGILSLVVVAAWLALSGLALASHDSLAGVAILWFALYVVAALGLIWLVIFFVWTIRVSRRAARSVRSSG